MKSNAIVFSLFFIIFIGLWGLGDTLVPLIFSFTLAYLLYPIIIKLEAKGLRRVHTVPGLFALIVLLMILVISLVLPGLIKDGHTFLNELPVNSSRAINKIEVFSNRFGFQLDLSKDSLGEYLREHVSEISGGMLKSLTQAIKSSFTGVAKFLIAILKLFLIPLFFFYIINDYEKLSGEFKSFIPKSFAPKFAHYLSLSNVVLSGYIRGQLMVALALSGLYAVGLTLVGLKFGALIGLISGLISIIPYAGFTIGFVTAIIVGLSNYTELSQIFGIIAVFVVVQALEGMIITPKLVGNKLGLSTFATILVLIIGGNLFGLFGMLVAIPVAAVLKSIVAELKQEYLSL